MKFDIAVASLRTRDTKLKQEKKEFGRYDKKDNGSGKSLFIRERSIKRENSF